MSENIQEPKLPFLSVWGGFLLGLIVLAVFLWAPHQSPLPPPAQQPAPAKVAPVTPTEAALPSFEGARAIFAITTTPSEKLLANLEASHQKGTQVRLVTTSQVQTSFQSIVVPAERIVRNAILIDGTAWYPLP